MCQNEGRTKMFLLTYWCTYEEDPRDANSPQITFIYNNITLNVSIIIISDKNKNNNNNNL